MKKYWEKSKEFRQSMPDIIPDMSKDFLEIKEGDSYIDKINKKFLQYQEVKYVYKKTKIKPFYYLIFIIIALSFILIGYFDKYLTLILATIYPLFMTFKALQYSEENDIQSKIEVIHWLKYWIFFCVFLNFESLFGYLFRRVYFVFKIIFLLNCFPINSRLTIWIYNTCKEIVIKYEKIIVESFKNIYQHITQTKKELEKKKEAMKNKNKKDDDYQEKISNFIKGGKATFEAMKNIY